MLRTITIASFLCFALVPAARPQAIVKALASDLEPLEETTDIRLTRFADFTDEDAVRLGMELEPGDLLASGSGAVDLELECAGGTLLRFTGNFRVLVDIPSDGVDCAVNFLSGTVDVLTDQPTEVQAGGVVLGSEGTQYTVELETVELEPRGLDSAEVSGRSRQPEVRCQVFDGRVEWRSAKRRAEWLSAGSSLRVVGRTDDNVESISAEQLSKTALRYARFDVVNARRSGQRIDDGDTVTRDLAKVHEMVLARPKDTQVRVDLAKTQLRYDLSRQADYNLRAVGVSTEEQLRVYQIDATQLRVQPTYLYFQNPWTLVQQKKFKEAIQAGKKKVEAGNATSRDYYALALAYLELGGKRSSEAATYARRAVALHRNDGELNDREVSHCRKIASGY